jgi:hypothetical protein
VNIAAVAWGVLLVINTGWPRPEIFGDGWLGRTGAAVPTAAMIAVGLLYDRLVRRHRAVGVIAEHRADLTGSESVAEVPPAADEPRARRRPIRGFLRPRRLTRPRR